MDEARFDKRAREHQEKAQEYIEIGASARTTFHSVSEAWDKAREALISSGAVVVDKDGNIQKGWYDFDGLDPRQFSSDRKDGGIGKSGGAASIAAALGAPAAAWTLVGTFGTASTGAAIGGLSGAAATSATAAWFGLGSLAAGGFGVAAAPFVLTGIGAIAGLIVLGAVTFGRARSRRNRQQEEMKQGVRIMGEAEKRMEANRAWFFERQGEASKITEEFIKATAILEFISKHNQATNQYVTSIGEKMNEAGNLVAKVLEGPPFERIYLGEPGVVNSIKSVHAGGITLRIQWDDPDDGESEIYRYRVAYKEKGLWSEEARKLTDQPEITLEKLKRGTEYEFTITARNPIGWGEESVEFKARTTS